MGFPRISGKFLARVIFGMDYPLFHGLSAKDIGGRWKAREREKESAFEAGKRAVDFLYTGGLAETPAPRD